MEERRICDYFILAGVPENPTPLEEPESEFVKPATKLEPITDIGVIIKNLGEKCPLDWYAIEQTPTGFNADLNHGNMRQNEVYLCYKRGRKKPPLVDIGILFEPKERLLEGCEAVFTTPYGSPANVNNNYKERSYLTYKRAPENASTDLLVVTDIAVIFANRGEQPPPAFMKIDKPLNRSITLTDIYICYKKSRVRPRCVVYEPTVLSRYPDVDYPDLQFPEQVAKFCLPMGAAIECWPSHSQHPAPQHATFVLTSERGEKLYGSAISFYEDYPIDKLTDDERYRLGIGYFDAPNNASVSKYSPGSSIRTSLPVSDNKSNSSASPALSNRSSAPSLDSNATVAPAKSSHITRSICLLSHYPFFDSFRRFLLHLYKMTQAGSGPFVVPVERIISHLLYEVPFPAPQRPRVLVPLSELDNVCLSQPEDSPLPSSGASFVKLLSALRPDNMLTLFAHVLLEHKIVLHSVRQDFLTEAAEAISMMIFPLRWQCTYIPLCPISLSYVLNAPTPILVGVDSRYFDLHEPPMDVVCIDFDTWRIIPAQNDDKKNTNVSKLLPKKPRTFLLKALTDLHGEIMDLRKAQRRGDEPDSAYAIDYQFRIRQHTAHIDMAIQDVCLHFMANLLKGYKNFLRPITETPKGMSTNYQHLFDMQGFLKSRRSDTKPFFQQLLLTQHFSRFIENRSFVSEDDSSLAFFDDCVEKLGPDESGGSVNVSTTSISAISNAMHFGGSNSSLFGSTGSLTSDGHHHPISKLPSANRIFIELEESHSGGHSSRTFFVPPPEPIGLPAGKQYVYNQFPTRLDSELFLPRPQPLKTIAQQREDYRPRLGSEFSSQSGNSGPSFSNIGEGGGVSVPKVASNSSKHSKRSKFELRQAQKIAEKQAALPHTWAKCLVSNVFSLWYLHLPSFVSVSASPTKALWIGYEALKKMHKLCLQQPADEVCYRVLMELCGQYHNASLAVRILYDMKRQHIQPNAITYGFYNRVVLESANTVKFPSNALLLWNKLRLIVLAATYFRLGPKGLLYDDVTATSVTIPVSEEEATGNVTISSRPQSPETMDISAETVVVSVGNDDDLRESSIIEASTGETPINDGLDDGTAFTTSVETTVTSSSQKTPLKMQSNSGSRKSSFLVSDGDCLSTFSSDSVMDVVDRSSHREFVLDLASIKLAPSVEDLDRDITAYSPVFAKRSFQFPVTTTVTKSLVTSQVTNVTTNEKQSMKDNPSNNHKIRGNDKSNNSESSSSLSDIHRTPSDRGYGSLSKEEASDASRFVKALNTPSTVDISFNEKLAKSNDNLDRLIFNKMKSTAKPILSDSLSLTGTTSTTLTMTEEDASSEHKKTSTADFSLSPASIRAVTSATSSSTGLVMSKLSMMRFRGYSSGMQKDSNNISSPRGSNQNIHVSEQPSSTANDVSSLKDNIQDGLTSSDSSTWYTKSLSSAAFRNKIGSLLRTPTKMATAYYRGSDNNLTISNISTTPISMNATSSETVVGLQRKEQHSPSAGVLMSSGDNIMMRRFMSSTFFRGNSTMSSCREYKNHQSHQSTPSLAHSQQHRPKSELGNLDYPLKRHSFIRCPIIDGNSFVTPLFTRYNWMVRERPRGDSVSSRKSQSHTEEISSSTIDDQQKIIKSRMWNILHDPSFEDHSVLFDMMQLEYPQLTEQSCVFDDGEKTATPSEGISSNPLEEALFTVSSDSTTSPASHSSVSEMIPVTANDPLGLFDRSNSNDSLLMKMPKSVPATLEHSKSEAKSSVSDPLSVAEFGDLDPLRQESSSKSTSHVIHRRQENNELESCFEPFAKNRGWERKFSHDATALREDENLVIEITDDVAETKGEKKYSFNFGSGGRILPKTNGNSLDLADGYERKLEDEKLAPPIEDTHVNPFISDGRSPTPESEDHSSHSISVWSGAVGWSGLGNFILPHSASGSSTENNPTSMVVTPVAKVNPTTTKALSAKMAAKSGNLNTTVGSKFSGSSERKSIVTEKPSGFTSRMASSVFSSMRSKYKQYKDVMTKSPSLSSSLSYLKQSSPPSSKLQNEQKSVPNTARNIVEANASQLPHKRLYIPKKIDSLNVMSLKRSKTTGVNSSRMSLQSIHSHVFGTGQAQSYFEMSLPVTDFLSSDYLMTKRTCNDNTINHFQNSNSANKIIIDTVSEESIPPNDNDSSNLLQDRNANVQTINNMQSDASMAPIIKRAKDNLFQNHSIHFLPPSIEVEMCSTTRCDGCNFILYDENILSGWSKDVKNMPTTCWHCNARVVPLLQIYVKDFREIRRILLESSNFNQPYISKEDQLRIVSNLPETFTIEYLSVHYLTPLVLRKELETILLDEGNEALKQINFISNHADVFWNLIWYYHRLSLPTHLTGLIFRLKCMGIGIATKITPDILKEAVKRKKTDGGGLAIEDERLTLLSKMVKITAIWDDPKLHSHFGLSLYQQWITCYQATTKQQQNESKNQMLNAIVTDGNEANALTNRSFRQILSRLLIFIEGNDLAGAVQLLHDQRIFLCRRRTDDFAVLRVNGNNDKNIGTRSSMNVVTFRSIYRELLFFILVVYGRDSLDLAVFDREYKRCYNEILKNGSFVQKNDEPPSTSNQWCRRLFSPLTL